MFKRLKTLLTRRTLPEALHKMERCYTCERYTKDCCLDCKDQNTFLLRLARGFCPVWETPAPVGFEASDRINLTFYSVALLCGGAERWLVDLATNLDPKIFNICVAISEITLCDEALLERVRSVETLVFGRETCQKFMDTSDILITWDSHPKNKAKTSIYCSHGCDHNTDRVVRKYGNRKDYLFTAVSQAAAEPWLKQKPAILYNGSDTERLKPVLGRKATRESLGVVDDEFVVGYISRMDKGKNPHLVAEAAHFLRKQGYKAKALYVCEPNPRVEIKHEALYRPRTEQIGDYLAAMDLFMLPSKSEAFSLAIIEAWLTKTPVLATMVGAIPELEDEYGTLVYSLEGDFKSRVQLAHDQVRRERTCIADAAYNMAIENFTTKAMVQRWTTMLESIA